MKIIVLGGDGFCGWPTALHLSGRGHDVTIVDNLSRRRIDGELGVQSLTPILPVTERLAAWKEVSGRDIAMRDFTVGRDFVSLLDLLRETKPDAIVHFAEQRAAPYSMKSAELLSMEDIANMIDAANAPKPRGPYKKKVAA